MVEEDNQHPQRRAFLKIQQSNKISILEAAELVRGSAHVNTNTRCLPIGKRVVKKRTRMYVFFNRLFQKANGQPRRKRPRNSYF